MKQNYIKFFIGLLCMVWLSAFAVPTTAHAEESEDTRTHIDRVDISTNIDSVFGYGKENTTLGPTLQMSQTTSEPVSLKPYYGFWQRYIDDDGRWEFSGYEYFISGQWSMTIQIRVTDVAYLIDNETAVYVDGELWEVWDKEDGSYPFIVVIPSRNSSRFSIEEPEELTFHKLGKYDISGQRVNTRIEPFSVVSSVEGGTAPYSYRKVSGPDWLEVSIEGTVSGKPTEIGDNEPLVVEVLDSKGEKAQITIPVDDTLEEYVIEVSSWQELENAFSQATGGGTKKEYLTIRLTKDLYSSAYSTERDAQWIHQYEIYCASVIFDFNGHTLSCEDDVSDTDIEYTLKDFINIKLSSGSYDFGSSIRFIDSVGGGGIEMYSKRAWETCDLAALHIEAGESSFYGVHQVYFDGGKYELNAESSKVGVGTLSPLVDYRGCVITEEVSVEINDGHFIAKGEGAKFSVGDTCARELSAFGTFEHARFNVTSVEEIEKMFGWDEIVINGGIFESNGYAVHHFDISENGLDSTRGMLFPTINGGYFIGQMGYTGLTFTYSDGNELFNNQPATSIISKDSYVMGIDKDGDKFYTLEDITLKDLHDLQSCIVLGKETVQMKTSPVAGSYPASLIRESTQTETYTIEYKEPSWFATGGIQCVPYYKIQGWQSATTTSKTGKTEVTVDYSKYKHNGGVDVKLGVMYITPWNTTDYSFENEYNVELQVFYDITDACENCYITPVNGNYSVFKGDDFSFKIYADENYEIDESGSLEVSINPSNYGEVTWDSATNTYTVPDVVGDISISVYKNEYGPTGVLQLKLDMGAGQYKDLGSQLAGTTYTLKTPEEYGLTVPSGYKLEKWTVTMGNNTPFSVPLEGSFSLSGAGDVIIAPKYENLYNIQVINGKAYADEAHTQPISSLAEENIAYFVADAPEAGKVFWQWNVIAGSSIHYTDVKEMEFSKTIYEDTVYEACYATQIDEVALTVLSEDIAPEAGKTVPQVVLEASEFYDYIGLQYYDVTDGTPLTVGIDNFEVGHVYQIQVQACVKTDAGYVFDDIAEMKAVVEGLTGYESVEFASVSGYDKEQYKVLITFPVIEGPEGVTVSGTITSSGSEGYRVEVTLTNVEDENISYVRYLMGNSATYSIDGVMPGTYTLKVEKIGHVDYETTIVVSDVDVVQDVELEERVVNAEMYKFGQTVQIRLIEPWGLKANVRVHDGVVNYIDYSELYNYGVYFIRKSDLDVEGATQDTLTIDDIVGDSDATHMSKGNGVTVEGSVLTATYDKKLYTYQFSDSVFVMFYIIPFEGASPIYAPIRERNLSALICAGKDDNSLSLKERNVYISMNQLETDILSYRADFENPSVPPEQNAPTLSETPLSGAIANTGKYFFGHTVQIRLVEPWGLKVNARVYTQGMTSGESINYEELIDYGVIMVVDNNASITTAEEFLARPDAYIFSKANGEAQVSGNVITATFSKGIYTYLLDSNVYVMFYVKDADGYHFGAVKERNVYNLMNAGRNDAAILAKEKALYNDMVNLYEVVTTYRADYLK